MDRIDVGAGHLVEAMLLQANVFIDFVVGNGDCIRSSIGLSRLDIPFVFVSAPDIPGVAIAEFVANLKLGADDSTIPFIDEVGGA